MGEDREEVRKLFCGWEETMIWSSLQGHMGQVITDGKRPPKAAQIIIGDFCFFAGQPDEKLIKQAGAPILTPQNEAWSQKIEAVVGGQVFKTSRYSMKKEPDVFEPQKLIGFTKAIPQEYELRLIDRDIYHSIIGQEWSRDLCSQFEDFEDFHKRGLGVVVLHGGIPVSGASSYTIYSGGIEIEIDTKPKFRRKGLARACGAKLILECLDRGLYPSWDAHNLGSAALAEQLGYHRDVEYPVYIKR